MRTSFAIIVFTLASLSLWGQKYPERRMVRAGNSQYEKQNYVEAEVAYRRAIEKTPDSYEASDNLAKSLYKQKRWDEAAKLLAPLAADSLRREHSAAAYYDLGNALFRQRKLEEALEAYKQSLRINPDDMEAKFNLAYTQKLLDKNKGGGQDDKQDDQNQDQQQQDQQQQGRNKDQKQDQQDGNDGSKPQPQPGDQAGVSRQEAEQMLQAIQAAEDKTREKTDGEKVRAAAAKGGKNW